MPIYPTNTQLNKAIEALAGGEGFPMFPVGMTGIQLLTSNNTDDVITGAIEKHPDSNAEFSLGAAGEISNTYGITLTNGDPTPTATATHIHFTDGADIHFVLEVAEPFSIPAATNEGMTPGEKFFAPRSLVLRIRASV